MSKPKKLKGWIAYLALVAAVLVVHACAVEFDSQAEAAAPARHA